MKVVLQEKIANLGNVGDQVVVKPGFARNYLLPFNKALPATNENIAQFEARRAELEKAAAEVLTIAQRRADQLKELTVTIEAQAGDEGKLFGSIGPKDIAEAVTKAGVELSKSEVDLPEGPIRNIGEYQVKVILHSDVTANVNVHVVTVATTK